MMPVPNKSKVLLMLAALLLVVILLMVRHHAASNPIPQPEAVSVPVFAYAHNWALDTPVGTFGYVEILFKNPSVWDKHKTERTFMLGHRGFETRMSPESVATCALVFGVGLTTTLGYFILTLLKGDTSNEKTA